MRNKRCARTKKDGKRCTRRTIRGGDVCVAHYRQEVLTKGKSEIPEDIDPAWLQWILDSEARGFMSPVEALARIRAKQR
jgi:hypothetical protein